MNTRQVIEVHVGTKTLVKAVLIVFAVEVAGNVLFRQLSKFAKELETKADQIYTVVVEEPEKKAS